MVTGDNGWWYGIQQGDDLLDDGRWHAVIWARFEGLRCNRLRRKMGGDYETMPVGSSRLKGGSNPVPSLLADRRDPISQIDSAPGMRCVVLCVTYEAFVDS